MIEIRRLSTILVGVAIALVIIALVTPKWFCGNIFDRYCTRQEFMLAVLVLLLIGVICMCVVFILDVLSHCSDRYSGNGGFITARFIILYIGSAALFIALLIYISKSAQQWSFFLATVGSIVAIQVAILAILTSRCVSISTQRVVVRSGH